MKRILIFLKILSIRTALIVLLLPGFYVVGQVFVDLGIIGVLATAMLGLAVLASVALIALAIGLLICSAWDKSGEVSE